MYSYPWEYESNISMSATVTEITMTHFLCYVYHQPHCQIKISRPRTVMVISQQHASHNPLQFSVYQNSTHSRISQMMSRYLNELENVRKCLRRVYWDLTDWHWTLPTGVSKSKWLLSTKRQVQMKAKWNFSNWNHLTQCRINLYAKRSNAVIIFLLRQKKKSQYTVLQPFISEIIRGVNETGEDCTQHYHISKTSKQNLPDKTLTDLCHLTLGHLLQLVEIQKVPSQLKLSIFPNRLPRLQVSPPSHIFWQLRSIFLWQLLNTILSFSFPKIERKTKINVPNFQLRSRREAEFGLEDHEAPFGFCKLTFTKEMF